MSSGGESKVTKQRSSGSIYLASRAIMKNVICTSSVNRLRVDATVMANG